MDIRSIAGPVDEPIVPAQDILHGFVDTAGAAGGYDFRNPPPLWPGLWASEEGFRFLLQPSSG